MAAPDVELAEALAEDINDSARNWPILAEAERSWVPNWVGKRDLAGLQCLIVPWPIVEVTPESRHKLQFIYSMDFGFGKRLDSKNTGEIDGIRELVHAAVLRYAVTDINVANVGKFVALRRLDEYVTFDPNRIIRTRDGNKTNYTGDMLSMFRVPYRFDEAV